MEPKSTFVQLLFVPTVLLIGMSMASSQTNGAADNAAAPIGNLFAPQLTIELRSRNKSELADTWPSGLFVPKRLTSAPSYDPVFRLPNQVGQSPAAPVTARTVGLEQSRRVNAPSKPTAQHVLNFPAILQRLTPPSTQPVKVLLPADK